MVVLSEISASSSSAYHYDVFLSFRGADTRYGFTDHLHKALLDAAIDTFFDDVEIQTGEDLKPELESAIRASRASIIVLSKDYASSTWCLDELVLILEQRRSSKHIVIPIFYHVKPTDVRKQQSSFGDSMASHKQKMEAEPNDKIRSQRAQKMKQWEKALKEVADMKGEEANGRRETILIEKIVKEITSRLELNKQGKVPDLIGMNFSVEYIISSLKNDTTEFLTIWGIGGIGKTYLANYVFKLHYLDFERSSFLEDIERSCMQPNTLLDLQKQLLKDLGDITWMDIHDANVATSKIEKLLLRNKTLLVLDGIDHFEQLDVLIGTRGLHPGSKIIVTTKDASLTEKSRLFMTEFPPNHMKHLLEGLNEEESQQLLGFHAFNGDYPNESYREQARKVLMYCGGHPLALTVLGRSLRKEDVAAWKDTIKLLQKKPNHKIQQVLQVSFDSLPSENDKELFKHIACFFIGEDKEFVEAILRECDVIPTFGFSKLIDRCLIRVGEDNKLRMHQLLQELGRDLVRQESLEKPWKRSRLWHHKESYDVLKQEKGTAKVQGLVLDMRMIENFASHGACSFTMERFGDVRRKIGARPLLHRVCDIFSWIWCLFAWVFFLRSSYSNELDIKTKAFIKMDKLRLLQLNYVQLHGPYKHFPTGLRWLSMHGFPLSYLPSELQFENIVALDMSYSNLQHLWKKPKLLRSLKFLILSCCHELVSVVGFDGFPLLERLILSGCVSLVEVCESIGNCDRLLLLDLSKCGKLKRLPRSIRRLKNLRTLVIDGCSNLGEFPVGIKDMESLEVLKADDVNRESQVSSSSVIVNPRSLKPFTLSLPSSLVVLSLKNNNLSNESFPVSFGSLSMLKELDLSENRIDSLPSCVRNLSRLSRLHLSRCRRLKTVLCSPRSLDVLDVNVCVSLEKVTFHPETSSRPYIYYKDTKALTEIEGILEKHVISGVHEEVLCRLGWINGQHVKNDKFPTVSDVPKAQGKILRIEMIYAHQQLLNSYSCQENRVLTQMFGKYVIFTTYFQGNRLPDWITYRSSSSNRQPLWITPESSSSLGLHFKLPSCGKSCRIRGLNVCIMTTVSSNESLTCPNTKISNFTKGYCIETFDPKWWVAPKINEEGGIVWISHWICRYNEFDDGDEVSVNVADIHDHVVIKEYGVSFVYDDDDDDDADGNKREDPLAYYKSWKGIGLNRE